MKKIITILTILGIFSFSSCNDFLDEELDGEYTSNNIYNTEEEANLALTGVYNSLSFTTSSNMIWVFGDVASDDAVKGGSASDQAEIGMIDEFNIKSDNGILLSYWKFAYEGINRANNVIHANYGAGVDDGVKQQMIAQAKFIRAYYYFNLVNIWGKVPLRIEPVRTSNVNMGLSEVAQIYSRIEQDLNDAAGVLPPSYTQTADKGRITKGAAYGLLAKVQLYQKKWDDCITTITTKLEPLGLYGLEANYEDLFKLGAEDSREAIFSILHESNQNPGLGNSLNQWFAPLVEGGYYFNAPTNNYVLSFSEQTTTGQTDPRLDASIGRSGKEWLNDDVFDLTWSITGYLVKKHNQPLAEVPAGTKGDGGLPYIYLRYADILLMKAEAYTEANDLDKAAAALKLVRDRAGLAYTKPVNQEQMRSVIYLERRRELGFEFHRFFDLMRWGKDVATQALGSDFKWQEPRYYFPIPQNELDSNNGI